MSHNATSTLPIAIGSTKRLMRVSWEWIAPMSSGSRPTSSGLKNFRICPATSAGPALGMLTKLLPSIPSSVWIRRTPIGSSPPGEPNTSRCGERRSCMTTVTSVMRMPSAGGPSSDLRVGRGGPRRLVGAPVRRGVPAHDVLLDGAALERRDHRAVEQLHIVLHQRLPLRALPGRLEGRTVVEPAVDRAVVGPLGPKRVRHPVVLHVASDPRDLQGQLSVRRAPLLANLLRIQLRAKLDHPNALVHPLSFRRGHASPRPRKSTLPIPLAAPRRHRLRSRHRGDETFPRRDDQGAVLAYHEIADAFNERRLKTQRDQSLLVAPLDDVEQQLADLLVGEVLAQLRGQLRPDAGRVDDDGVGEPQRGLPARVEVAGLVAVDSAHNLLIEAGANRVDEAYGTAQAAVVVVRAAQANQLGDHRIDRVAAHDGGCELFVGVRQLRGVHDGGRQSRGDHLEASVVVSIARATIDMRISISMMYKATAKSNTSCSEECSSSALTSSSEMWATEVENCSVKAR